ncbi:MAG: TIGR04211 family SH3 domain-containing protein [Gammaproteobacteria bacterium]|nr:TIGR04211 family SH3 domain-containing protein [Gammaproteobacteria bacterium]
MRNGWLKTLLLLLLCQGAHAAQTLYVHDQLRLGVRPSPDSAGSSIAVVTTGDALTVLGEQESFVRIRTERGVEGWVSRSYLSDEPPARSQLEQLQQTHQALQQAHEELQQQLTQGQQQAGEQAVRQTQEIELLQRDQALLQQQLARYTRINPGLYEKYRWPALLFLLLACFIAGFIAGMRNKARQVAERIGGLEI